PAQAIHCRKPRRSTPSLFRFSLIRLDKILSPFSSLTALHVSHQLLPALPLENSRLLQFFSVLKSAFGDWSSDIRCLRGFHLPALEACPLVYDVYFCIGQLCIAMHHCILRQGHLPILQSRSDIRQQLFLLMKAVLGPS